MKLKPSTILAACVLIAVGGFLAGRVSSSASGPANSSDNLPEARTSRTGAALRSVAEAMDGKRSNRDRSAKSADSKDPTARLAKLESILRGENALDRNRALLAYIDQLGPGDFQQAVTDFRSLGITEDRLGEYSLLLTAWANVDPTAALAFAKDSTSGKFATNAVITAWAANDPEGAIQWAKANFDGNGANPYLPGIIRAIAGSDPTRASDLLTSMPRSLERAEGLDALLPNLLRQGAASTRAWIDALIDDSLKNGAMTRTARELAATDPAGTASWLLANPGEATKRRFDDVYSIWAQKDQQAAMNSYSALPAGENRSNALRGIVSGIASENPNAAVSLLNRYPNDVTDRVVQNVVWHSLRSDPSLAVSQIGRISDESQRNRTYQYAIRNWLGSDPASAQSWMNANPLPPAVQKALTQ